MIWRNLLRLNADFLIRQLQALIPGPPIGVAVIFRTKGAAHMGEITVADDETTLTSHINPLDSEGQQTTLDSPPTYSSSDENVAVAAASDDGLDATYTIGSPGDAVITVDTGVDDGQGGTIQGKGTIHVTPGGVATLSVDFATGAPGAPMM